MDSRANYVLLIENKAEIQSLIADQALIPLGYRVDIFESASAVIQDIASLTPSLIISDLDLQGFSCKDLMIALATLGLSIPVIVVAGQGRESDILQSIRLGAADFLIYPAREAEVIRVVEKALNNYRLASQIDQVTKQLEASQALVDQQRTDFSVIYDFYQYVLSSDDRADLAGNICRLALRLSGSDCAWLSMFDENLSKLSLLASENLPEKMQTSLMSPYEDDLEALVAACGQPVSLHGEALSRFIIFNSFGAVLVIPLSTNQGGSPIIVAARKAPEPFNLYQVAMIELIGVIASIAYGNEERKHQLEHLATYLRQENIFTSIESSLKYDLLRQASLELRSPLKNMVERVDYVLERNNGSEDGEQAAALNGILDQAEIMMDIADSMITYRQVESIRMEPFSLADALRSTANRFRPIAQLGKISIELEIPAEQAIIMAYGSQITRVIEGLLSNALKYCPSDSVVLLRLEIQDEEFILSVIDQGAGIDEHIAEGIFENKSSVFGYSSKRFGGIGISLPRIKAVISAYNGRIWIEPPQGGGFSVKLALPRQAGGGV